MYSKKNSTNAVPRDVTPYRVEDKHDVSIETYASNFTIHGVTFEETNFKAAPCKSDNTQGVFVQARN